MNRYQQITLTRPQAWCVLALTIGCEVGATLSLKTSDGFTRPLPSAASVFGFALAIVFLAKVLEVIPTSIAYTVWTGVGSALVVVFGIVVFGDDITMRGLLGIVLVVTGVVILNMSGATPAEPPL
jgi:multidrug transporter EmrE-like cation transporter